MTRRAVDFTVAAGFLVAIVGVFSAWAGTEWWWAVIVAGVAVMLAAAAVDDINNDRTEVTRMNWLHRIFGRKQRESNLVAHARRELAMLGDDGEPMNRRMNEHLLGMVELFAKEGHSGFSAGYAIHALTKLLDFEPLLPLTGEPDEWVEVGEGMYQNRRCGRVFSWTGTPDGYAYDVDGKVFVEPGGIAYTNGESRVPVTFPYTPKTERIEVEPHA